MTNSTLYGTLPQGTTYYTNYTCPPNFRSLDDCQAIQTDCLSDDGTQDYVLQCSRPYRKFVMCFLLKILCIYLSCKIMGAIFIINKCVYVGLYHLFLPLLPLPLLLFSLPPPSLPPPPLPPSLPFSLFPSYSYRCV